VFDFDDRDDRDEYEKYEDMYCETGYDPYGLFDDVLGLTRVERLIIRIRRVTRKITRLVYAVRYIGSGSPFDDIPF